ncbi:MAG: hypothetical protein EBY17_22635 [Acidobacteriia bacterium]|nr:hypothetical protein [Terriglobia bacterium]
MPKAPIASTDSVLILVNDQDYVPSSGLYSAAILSAGRRGPYRIQRCVPLIGADGNLLIITTSNGTASVRIPEGDQVPISQVARAIRLATDIVTVEDRDGVLSLIDNDTPGLGSFIRLSGGVCTALGFTQIGARGKEIYPPWQLVTYYDTLPTELPAGVFPVPSRRPKFIRPLAGNPTIKITYAAMSDRCPRCGGTYVENDYRFDIQGDMALIQDEDLLYQACLKAILTVLGSNPYHPAYGSAVTTRIGAKAIAATQSLIRSDIQTALERVKSLQAAQGKYQAVSAEERLYAINNVQVDTDPNDPTTFQAQVTVKNASNRTVLLNIVFTVPGVVALKGTNGLSLGIQPTVIGNA